VPSAGIGGYQAPPLIRRMVKSHHSSTVERRNPAIKENPTRICPHGLTEAHTYAPTPEEFKDPMEYIRSIAQEGRKYGIVIILPKSWQPEFGIHSKVSRPPPAFTRICSACLAGVIIIVALWQSNGQRKERSPARSYQAPLYLLILFAWKQLLMMVAISLSDATTELNLVEGGTRANLNYLDQLSKYPKKHGTSLNRFTSVDKWLLDLYRQKRAAKIRGCSLQFAGAKIGRRSEGTWDIRESKCPYLRLSKQGRIRVMRSSSSSTSLKNSYSRYLQQHEEWVKSAKPGVQLRIEAEFGGPITSSPDSTPMKGAQVQKNGLRNGSFSDRTLL
jgi:hypothetical protein